MNEYCVYVVILYAVYGLWCHTKSVYYLFDDFTDERFARLAAEGVTADKTVKGIRKGLLGNIVFIHYTPEEIAEWELYESAKQFLKLTDHIETKTNGSTPEKE